jgi:cold shock CspA family protein
LRAPISSLRASRLDEIDAAPGRVHALAFRLERRRGDDGDDHFFHISRVLGHEAMQQDDIVDFEVEMNPTKGKLQATAVRRLQRADGGDGYGPTRFGDAFFERDGDAP